MLMGVAILLTIFTFGIKPAELVDKISEMMQNAREYDEDDEEEEEEVIERPKKKKKEKTVKSHSVIMTDPFGEDEEVQEVKETKKVKKGIMPKFEVPEIDDAEETEICEEPKQDDYIEANLFKEAEKEKQDNTKQILQLEHAQIVEDQNYEFPPIAILEQGQGKKAGTSKKLVTDNALKLQKTLHSFGVAAKVEDVAVGPAITRYELKPAEGVRVNKIANLADDIALNLAAQSIRIEAPIPGKQAVGIEIPNKDTEMVHLRDVIDSEEFALAESKLSVGLGKDVSGARVIADIAKMPHLLVARKYRFRKECMYKYINHKYHI